MSKQNNLTSIEKAKNFLEFCRKLYNESREYKSAKYPEIREELSIMTYGEGVNKATSLASKHCGGQHITFVDENIAVYIDGQNSDIDGYKQVIDQMIDAKFHPFVSCLVAKSGGLERVLGGQSENFSDKDLEEYRKMVEIKKHNADENQQGKKPEVTVTPVSADGGLLPQQQSCAIL